MLRNLSPIITGGMLTALNDTPPGSWIAVTSRPPAPRVRTIETAAPLEHVVAALFQAILVSTRASHPLIGWLADPHDEESLDAFFTFQGTARDTHRRPFEMGRLMELPVTSCENVSAVIIVPYPVDFAFFVCVGPGEHHVMPLITQPRHNTAA